MKILHVTPFFYPAWSYGGIPRLSFHMAATQARMGHEVEVVTTDALDKAGRQPKTSFRVEGINVRVHRNLSNRAAYRYQAFMPSGMMRERKLPSRFDIMHIHGHRNLLNTVMARFGRKAGKPVVMQPNGTLVNIEQRIFLKKIYDLILGDRQIGRTTGFIAVSEAEKEQFIRAGIDERKIRVIPNGVFISSRKSNIDFKRYQGVEGDYILYLGKITPRKGIEQLVRAMPLLRDRGIRLVIAGNDMGHLPAIKAEISRLGLTNRVVITGLLTGDMKTAAYNSALYTVYVSSHEIFGLVPFESLLCGTPVIVASDSGCGEWVAKAGAGHVVPYGDPRAIADVINGREEAREAEAVERGRKYIAENLGWEKVTARVIEFYEELSGRA